MQNPVCDYIMKSNRLFFSPINYELTIQFAFEWADGKQFNKNKKPILRQLGFTKDEIKALSRHEGHSAECHDVSFWEQKRFFKCKL